MCDNLNKLMYIKTINKIRKVVSTMIYYAAFYTTGTEHKKIKKIMCITEILVLSPKFAAVQPTGFRHNA